MKEGEKDWQKLIEEAGNPEGPKGVRQNDCNFVFSQTCNGFETEPWFSIRNGRRMVLSQITATLYSSIGRPPDCNTTCGVTLKLIQLKELILSKDMEPLKQLLKEKYQDVSARYLANLQIKDGKSVRRQRDALLVADFVCPPGHVLLYGQACIQCGRGFYSPTFQSHCIPCPQDYYQSYIGSIKCKRCPENMVTLQDGAPNNAYCLEKQTFFQKRLDNNTKESYKYLFTEYRYREIFLIIACSFMLIICIITWVVLVCQDSIFYSMGIILLLEQRVKAMRKKLLRKGIFGTWFDDSFYDPLRRPLIVE